jgi:hypothetical protein
MFFANLDISSPGAGRSRLDLTPAEEELLPPSPSEVVPQQLTAGGDQACFV